MRRLFRSATRFLRRELLRDPFLLEVKRWYRDRGDETLRLAYPLCEDSVVIDLGGYRGDFAFAVNRRFGCRVFVYEPMPSFFEACAHRFRSNPRVECRPYGLSSKTGQFDLSVCEDASSFVQGRHDAIGVKAELRPVVQELDRLGLANVDLLKVNIEGGEYELLSSLLESGAISRIRFLQVQFHNFVPDAATKRAAIQRSLSGTHTQEWNYEFVWESWSRRSAVAPLEALKA